jgi:hypothetical protein
MRNILANIIGILSVLCSLTFWIEIAVTRIAGQTPTWLDIGLNGWLTGWSMGLLLSIGAAGLKRRWAFAVPLPVLSFLAAVAAVNWKTVQW